MRRALLLLPLFGLACLIAGAQPSSPGSNAVTEVHVGNSVIPLPGPWKFEPGDSPQISDAPLWASPGFDDSHWFNMDLSPKPGAHDAAYGNAGYVTGWSVRGFPNLSGYAWYRLCIHVGGSTEPLWLKMPDHTDDSYQVFANGQYVDEFGHFTARGVQNFRSRPRIFPLPTPDQNGDIVLAIRFFMEPFVIAGGTTSDTGGMHQTPLIGLRAPIESLLTQSTTGRILGIITDVFVALLTLIAAAAAFWIWILDRPRKTYLWLTLSLLLSVAPVAVLLVGFFTYAITQGIVNFLTETFTVLALVCWLFFWRRWFQLAHSVRFNLCLTAIVAVHFISQFFILFARDLSRLTVFLGLGIIGTCDAALGLLLFFILLQSFRKDRTGALVALPPILLLGISLLSNELIAWFNIRTSFFPLGIQISVKDVAVTLMVLVVGVLVARRFVTSQVAQRLERQTIDQDLEHASELQQRVLIPEPIDSDVFTVDTAYYPARTVGGDFFQVIPYPDGSLLLVVGDVSGKGIGAAMLVAVLVGTALTAAESTADPADLLFCLNDRMIGRAGGHFATCIAAHITTDGTMRIANAGHIPPYRNGVSMDLPGAIPLGIIPGASYDVATVQLNPGDRLTFLTDGVPEARNDAGDLLGFDETASLSSLPPEAIAQAASAHGQDDDITVVSVRFHPASLGG